MPRDSSGNYTLPAGNPVADSTVISSTWANPTMGDIANEITQSLDRNGRGGMLVPFRNVDGTVSAPGITFTAEPSTGIYRALTNDVRMSIGNDDTTRWIDANSQPVGEQEPFQIWDGQAWESPLVDGSSPTFKDTVIEEGFGLVIGHTAPISIDGGLSKFSIVGTDSPSAQMAISRFSDVQSPLIIFMKSKDPSIGGHKTVEPGDGVGAIYSYADDGTTYDTIVSRFRTAADPSGVVSTGVVPGTMTLSVADSLGVLRDILVLDSNQTATFSGDLATNRNLYLDGGVDTFLREPSDNTIEMVCGGVVRMTLNGAAADFDAPVTALVPIDFWQQESFRDIGNGVGWIGTNAGFAVSMFSNAYRNVGGNLTSMNVSGLNSASSMELNPDGNIRFGADEDIPVSGSALTLRLQYVASVDRWDFSADVRLINSGIIMPNANDDQIRVDGTVGSLNLWGGNVEAGGGSMSLYGSGHATFPNQVRVTNGDLTVSAGDLTVSAGNITVSAGDVSLVTGQKLYLDTDADSYIYAISDDVIRIITAGTTKVVVASDFTVLSGGLIVTAGDLTLVEGSAFINCGTADFPMRIISTDVNVSVSLADSVGSSRLTNASGALVLYSGGDAASGTALNAVAALTLSTGQDATFAGNLTVTGLSGSGTRNVVVDANGVMSAP